MRILFTVLMGLLGCSNVFGQDIRLKNDVSTIPDFKKYQKNVSLTSRSEASYKTIADSDTVRIDEMIWGPDSICKDSLTNYYNYIKDFRGYINGTMGSVKLQNNTWAKVIEHGVNVGIPKKQDYSTTQVYAVLLGLAPTTKIIGDPDSFTVNVWKNSPVQSSSNVPPTFSARFSSDMYPSFPIEDQLFTPVFFDDKESNYNQISNNMLFSLVTAYPVGDDTLALFFNSNEVGCDPDNQNSWYYHLMKSDSAGTIKTHQGWVKMNSFLGFPPGLGPNIPLIVPVVVYKNVVGIDEAVSMDGLSMLNAFPNPSTEQTTLRFNLARNGYATIKVIDLMGRSVMPEVKFNAAKGLHEHTLDTRQLACGQYICVIQTNQGSLATRISVEK